MYPVIKCFFSQTIEEIVGVVTRISPRINEDFVLIKFALNKLHFIELMIDRSWDFELTLR